MPFSTLLLFFPWIPTISLLTLLTLWWRPRATFRSLVDLRVRLRRRSSRFPWRESRQNSNGALLYRIRNKRKPQRREATHAATESRKPAGRSSNFGCGPPCGPHSLEMSLTTDEMAIEEPSTVWPRKKWRRIPAAALRSKSDRSGSGPSPKRKSAKLLVRALAPICWRGVTGGRSAGWTAGRCAAGSASCAASSSSAPYRELLCVVRQNGRPKHKQNRGLDESVRIELRRNAFLDRATRRNETQLQRWEKMRHVTYTRGEPAGPRNPPRRLDTLAACSARLWRARLLRVLWMAEHNTSEFGTAPMLLEPKFAPAWTAPA